MIPSQIPTIDLLRMLTSREARKRSHESRSWAGYSDSSDESLLCDIIDTLAKRIDGKAHGPETKDPLDSET